MKRSVVIAVLLSFELNENNKFKSKIKTESFRFNQLVGLFEFNEENLKPSSQDTPKINEAKIQNTVLFDIIKENPIFIDNKKTVQK